MTAFLMVNTKNGNETYTYSGIEELHDDLACVFKRTLDVAGVTISVIDGQGTETMSLVVRHE